MAQVWAVAVAIYLLAVFHRSSLAVAGLAASDRFDISAAQLSTFTVLQLVVYAGMQVPVGLLLDRFGSRRMLVGALLVLTAGQTAFAFAETFAVALTARAFVGVGDAMTFICVLRLVNAWFSPRRISLATQLTGQIGQLGALAAAAPMTWALSSLGWTRSYLVAAGVGLVLLVALLVVVSDTPELRIARGPAISGAEIRASIAESWAHPGTRLGFWTHFTTMFSSTTLALLWGYPYFVQGEGRSSATAGALLSLLVVSTMVAGPVMGAMVSRRPFQRSTYVQPRPPAGQRDRPDQPSRLLGHSRARARHRPRARLADAGLGHELHARGVPVGDVVPVRAVGRGHRPAVALPPACPQATPRGRPRGVRPSGSGQAASGWRTSMMLVVPAHSSSPTFLKPRPWWKASEPSLWSYTSRAIGWSCSTAS